MKFDLSFGHSVAVRKAFLNTYGGDMIVITHGKLEEFNYPPYIGDPLLLQLAREVIEHQTGQQYKHLILTNGATGAINIVLSVYRMMGYESCITRRGPYYMRYPTMVSSAGLEHLIEGQDQTISKTVALLDYPSNPLNLMSSISDPGIPTILDGVYLSKVYMNIMPSKLPSHSTYVASYSKLTGLNGCRAGWIATNDDILYEKFKQQTIAAYCGLSMSESIVLSQLLYGFDWLTFEANAKRSLDYNREEFSKLEKYFSNKVDESGMFFYTGMDRKSAKLMKKSEVVWTKGSDLGTDDDFARFNLGQSNELVRDAVKAVLKADKI